MQVRNVSFLGETFVAINTKMEENQKIPVDLVPAIVKQADHYKNSSMPVVFADHQTRLVNRARRLMDMGAKNVHLAIQNFSQIFNKDGQLLIENKNKEINGGKPIPYTEGKIKSPTGGAYSDHATLPFLINEIKEGTKIKECDKGYDLEYVFIGHPEIKGSSNFKETENKINLKVREALDQEKKIILFVTNTGKEQGSKEIREPIIKDQLEKYLENVNLEKDASKINISYAPDDPIPDAAEVDGICKFIKDTVAEMAEKKGQNAEKVRDDISLGYANKVDDKNAKDYADQSDIDFVVLGGAGIDVEKAPKIIEVFQEKAEKKKAEKNQSK